MSSSTSTCSIECVSQWAIGNLIDRPDGAYPKATHFFFIFSRISFASLSFSRVLFLRLVVVDDVVIQDFTCAHNILLDISIYTQPAEREKRALKSVAAQGRRCRRRRRRSNTFFHHVAMKLEIPILVLPFPILFLFIFFQWITNRQRRRRRRQCPLWWRICRLIPISYSSDVYFPFH